VGGELAAGLGRLQPGQLGLVDSLGTWVAAHLELEGPEWGLRCEDLIGAIGACPAPLVVVCEETGWGVVPATAAGSRFRDRLGTMQQALQARSDAAWLVLQGRAIDLLALSQPVPQGS
jgi:adenosylcobinamide kinase/adenosylcobinamide-phosphate guanylyltransferase